MWRPEAMVKILMSVLCGAAIGFERQLAGKPAGLRTSILVTIGSAVLTDLSIVMAIGPDGTLIGDPARLAAQIISGVGFLGAGVILQGRGTVVGVTSAATIWITAAVGILLGAGRVIEGAGTTVVVLLTLAGLGRVERWAGWRAREVDVSLLLRPFNSALDGATHEELTFAFIVQEVKALGGTEARVEEVARDSEGSLWRIRAKLRGHPGRMLAPWLERHPQVTRVFQDD